MKFHSTYEFMYNCNGFIAVNQTIKVIGCLLFHNVVGYKSWLECFYASKYITTITHRQLCNTLSIRFQSFLNVSKQVFEASFRKTNLDWSNVYFLIFFRLFVLFWKYMKYPTSSRWIIDNKFVMRKILLYCDKV